METLKNNSQIWDDKIDNLNNKNKENMLWLQKITWQIHNLEIKPSRMVKIFKLNIGFFIERTNFNNAHHSAMSFNQIS